MKFICKMTAIFSHTWDLNKPRAWAWQRSLGSRSWSVSDKIRFKSVSYVAGIVRSRIGSRGLPCSWHKLFTIGPS